VISIESALAEQHAELAALLRGLDDAAWRQPTPCEGWTVSDVVLHLSQTDEMALASLEDRFADFFLAAAGDGEATTVDEGAALLVERARGLSGPEVRQRWEANAAALRDALATADPHRRVTWVAGELSARTLATTRLAECWIHTGDVADALGVGRVHGERLWHIARLAWRTIPYAVAREGRAPPGPVALHLRGPNGDRWDFVPAGAPTTVIRGDAVELCLVAARRVDPRDTALEGTGPDAVAVLDLVRTYA
jgi:uncharacterized protein (TIGR03084 family)